MYTPPPSESTPSIPEPVVGPPTPMPSQAVPAPLRAAGPRADRRDRLRHLRHAISSTGILPYTIRFENLPTATASAQVVRITQTLDPHLDPALFAFGEYGWGNYRFQAPSGVTSFRERYDLADEIGLYVDVEAVFDPDTGTLTWTFTAIDPRTMQIPDDDKGFLPVNIADHVGEGFVSYLRTRDAVQAGEMIYAQARIVFDTDDPIDTPLIFNTIASLPVDKPEFLRAPSRSLTAREEQRVLSSAGLAHFCPSCRDGVQGKTHW